MSLKTTPQGKLLREIIHASGNNRNTVDSYNWFITDRIPTILNETYFSIPGGYYLTFSSPEYSRPMMVRSREKGVSHRVPMLPMTARRERLSYMAEFACVISICKVEGNRLVRIKGESAKVLLGEIPVLTGSILDHVGIDVVTPEMRMELGESELQIPGQFIMQSEKLLMNIEKLRIQEPLLYEDNGEWVVRYTSQTTSDSSIVIIKEVTESHSKGKIKSVDVHATYTHIGIKKKSVNIFFLFYMLGSRTKVIEESLELMYRFIIDSDPKREEKRKFELRTYLQSTINSFLQSSGDVNHKTIIEYLAQLYSGDEELSQSQASKEALIHRFVRQDLFRNIPETSAEESIVRMYKANLLAYMVVKFIDFKNGYRPPDNRDWWGNKRVTNVGSHIESLFVIIWKELIRDLKSSIQTIKNLRINEIVKHINPNTMTIKFITSIKRGSWGSLKGGKETPIVDSNKTDNIVMSTAMVCRVTARINSKAQIVEKRQVNYTGWGIICPVMTPDGAMCGLMKELSQPAWISLARDISFIESKIKEHFLSIEEEMLKGKEYQEKSQFGWKNPIFFNGVMKGLCDSRNLYKIMIQLRRSKSIPFDTGIIILEDTSLSISTTPGRLCHPNLVVDEDEDLVIDKKNLRNARREILLLSGALEYLDSAEIIQPHIFIAVYEDDLKKKKERIDELRIRSDDSSIKELNMLLKEPKYTHCMIDPHAILGPSASITPFTEHMPGPRSSYQCGMSKQALGPDVRVIARRFDKTMRTIVSPGVPFVATDGHETLGLDKYPSGDQAIVAIMCYGGSNQEDAIIVNNSSLERGKYAMMIYHSYNATFSTTGNYNEEMAIPPDKIDDEAYKNIDKTTNLIRVGSYVKTDDVIIPKFLIEYQTDDKGKAKVKNASVKVDVGMEGYVDEVSLTPMEGGQGKLVQVRIREYRIPQTGDKFALRYSQKGVMGENVRGEEMPWILSEDPLLKGVVPDVIFNPHGFPSRMTVGMLIEMLEGMVSVNTGERFNATAFRKTVRSLSEGGAEKGLEYALKTLKEFGFSEKGKVKMVNGRTGKTIDTEIFVGPAYYQVLKHLVKDKMQARGTGPVQILTRQPVSGIRKMGGLKLGEMERDTYISHGASYVLQERMIRSSDAHQIIICTRCHSLADSNIFRNSFVCNNCVNEGQFVRAVVPYATILLSKYLSGTNISMKFFTTPTN